MPTYDYLCKNCGHKFEAFQTMKEPSFTDCPQCHHATLQRLIGAGAGLVFKGSGFYITDYKKSSSSKTSISSTTPSSTTSAETSTSASPESSSPPPAANDSKPADTKPADSGSTQKKE